MKEISIRKARLADRFAISRLTKKFPDTLDRSPQQVAKMINNFIVALNGRGEVIGCCGYKLWDNDAEIISWIIAKSHQGSDIGKKILLKLLRSLEKRKDVKNIFAVTVPALAKKYFEPLGFAKTGLQMFSGKVFADCRKCPKNSFVSGKYQCNEIALVLKK